jgi:hypothetical protein
MTCKKKQGDFNFALESKEGDFSRLNPKSKNIQTDASCTKLIVELCYILIILKKIVAFSNLNNQLVRDDGNRERKQKFKRPSYIFTDFKI